MVASADRDDHAPTVAGADDDVLGVRRAVEVVPLSKRPLGALDDQQGLAGHDQEALLVGLPVIHADRLARRKHEQIDPELREVHVALEGQPRAETLPGPPARLSRSEDEPALAGRDQPMFGGLQACLGTIGRS